VGTAALQGFWNVILTESLMFLPAGKGIWKHDEEGKIAKIVKKNPRASK
jgi:hypothetical protein